MDTTLRLQYSKTASAPTESAIGSRRPVPRAGPPAVRTTRLPMRSPPLMGAVVLHQMDVEDALCSPPGAEGPSGLWGGARRRGEPVGQGRDLGRCGAAAGVLRAARSVVAASSSVRGAAKVPVTASMMASVVGGCRPWQMPELLNSLLDACISRDRHPPGHHTRRGKNQRPSGPEKTPPADGSPRHGERGHLMLEDLLRAEAQALHDQYDHHDTDDFLRRLAVRIAQEAARPSRIMRAITDPAPPPPPTQALAQVPPPAGVPVPNRPTDSRPRTRRGPRRRPTPILTTTPHRRHRPRPQTLRDRTALQRHRLPRRLRRRLRPDRSPHLRLPPLHPRPTRKRPVLVALHRRRRRPPRRPPPRRPPRRRRPQQPRRPHLAHHGPHARFHPRPPPTTTRPLRYTPRRRIRQHRALGIRPQRLHDHGPTSQRTDPPLTTGII